MHKKQRKLQLASIIGLLVTAFSDILYAPLHYIYMEKDKTENLKINLGKLHEYMIISDKSLEKMVWWEKNIGLAFGYINKDSNPDTFIFSDASLRGLGCKYNDNSTKGYWSLDENYFASMHLN